MLAALGGLLIMAVYKKKKLNRIMYFIVYCFYLIFI